MIESVQAFAASFPDWLQWAGVLLVSAVPFVESYFGSVIGVAIGLHPVVAILVAVIGNCLSMLALVYGAGALRDRAVAKRPKGSPESEKKVAKRARLKRMFDKFGVPGVSLLGQTILPSQITSMAMVSFGADRNAVAIWQIISIAVWGVAFGTLATFGVQLALR